MDQLERHIIKEILAGRTDRFDWIVRTYGHRVFSLIVRIVACKEDAEELAQDVMIKVFDSLADFRGHSSLSSWIYRIAYTTAISAMRRRRQPEVAMDQEAILRVADADVDTLLDAPADADRTAALLAAIERLTPDERAIITLHYFQNLQLGEVAQITGLTLSNVKVRLMRTRRKLYLLMTHEQQSL